MRNEKFTPGRKRRTARPAPIIPLPLGPCRSTGCYRLLDSYRPFFTVVLSARPSLSVIRYPALPANDCSLRSIMYARVFIIGPE